MTCNVEYITIVVILGGVVIALSLWDYFKKSHEMRNTLKELQEKLSLFNLTKGEKRLIATSFKYKCIFPGMLIFISAGIYYLFKYSFIFNEGFYWVMFMVFNCIFLVVSIVAVIGSYFEGKIMCTIYRKFLRLASEK